MFFWRMTYIVLFALGAILLLLSAFSQHPHYLTWAFGVWGVTLVIWYIVEKLYADFTMPKSTQQNTDDSAKYLPIFFDF